VRRALLLTLILALPAVANERWSDEYDRGVKAVNARDYSAAVVALKAAIAAQPVENASLRTGNRIITYVPHFWLGIARFNTGDIDGALAEWKTSEEHRAIKRTDYAVTLREWVARAQTEKARLAKEAAAGSRKAADAALSRALAAQVEALSAGTDRSEGYRRGQQKLKEALAQFNAAGNDTALLDRAAAIANQASESFANPGIQRPEREPQRSVALQPVESTKKVEPEVISKPPDTQPAALKDDPDMARRRRELEAAYRAFARGELDTAEQLLDATLLTWRSGQAYLLRGCTRYTRSMLTRSTDLGGAASDFKLALLLSPGLKLEPNAFSPKLVAFFEQVRSSSNLN
jgi:hypothetical protein